MPIDITSWGIDENKSAIENSCAFLTNFENLNSPAELYLPAGTYEFNTMFFTDKDDIEFYGDTNTTGEPATIIKFVEYEDQGPKEAWCENSNRKWSRAHVHLDIRNADNFNIHDLAFDGIDGGDFEGGVWARDGSTNGILKNLLVYDAAAVSLVIGGTSKTNPAHHIGVEDCRVYGQREWNISTSKAMILAGGYGHDITFKNCETYSVSPYNNDFYSPADHFDTDNATNVEYHNCTADGSTDDPTIEEDDKGVGFWNEAGQQTDHETSSTYYGCTAIQTAGGLAASENSSVEAHNFYFDECSAYGWAARCQGHDANLEIYNSTFDKCYSQGDPPYLEGGVHFSSGDGVVEDCTFINTPDPEDPDEAFNVSFYSSDPNSYVTVTLENNTFDRGAKSHGVSAGSGDIYIINNDLGPNASFVKDGDYNWISSEKSATTTAVNRPTDSTIVKVEYESHITIVPYSGGESIDEMLVIMRDAINEDTVAHITADINTRNNSITFIQKDTSLSDNNVDLLFRSSAWGNGPPFNPMNPSMS